MCDVPGHKICMTLYDTKLGAVCFSYPKFNEFNYYIKYLLISFLSKL